MTPIRVGLMHHNLAHPINSGHFVQQTNHHLKTKCGVIKSHNTHIRESNNTIDQASPLKYLTDMVPAQSMNQCSNEVEHYGKLSYRSESGRKMTATGSKDTHQ